MANKVGFPLAGCKYTLDSGFDSVFNTDLIDMMHMRPLIKHNKRGLKDLDVLNWLDYRFNLSKSDYVQRIHVERGYAWEDVYKRLEIRHERLTEIFHAFQLISFVMINYRSIFNNPL
jgi:hypothetical protein